MELSEHFKAMWRKRVSSSEAFPAEHEILRILDNSFRIQRCMDLMRPSGRKLRILAIYWHPERDLILMVDDINDVAVSVINRHGRRFGRSKGRNDDRGGVKK